MNRCVVAGALIAASGAAGTAEAGGLTRPISGSPAAGGLAGAFTAIADDPYCLHANPAGCAFAPASVLVSLEMVYAPRSYTPRYPDGTDGSPQDAAVVAPVPVAGVLIRPGGADSRVTFGAGVWNTSGGLVSWDEVAYMPGTQTPAPQLTASTEIVIEAVGGAAWAVDDHVSLGAAIRVGVGVFSVETLNLGPVASAEISGSGVGLGGSAGILVRATDWLSLGLAWRSNLDITTSGSATLSGILEPQPMRHVQRWPQSASIAAAVQPSSSLTITAQLDWTQWSRLERLEITLPTMPNASQRFDLDWDDTFAVRAGVQYRVGRLVLRGGGLYDQNAVPDRTLERQYVDADKFGVAAGATIGLSSRVLLDLAVDWIGGPGRTIEDNSMGDPNAWRANVAPGEHGGQVYTLATGLRITL